MSIYTEDIIDVHKKAYYLFHRNNFKFGLILRLVKVALENNILLLIAEKGDMIPRRKGQMDEILRLKPTECVVTDVSESTQIACYPNIYAALNAANYPDHFISL